MVLQYAESGRHHKPARPSGLWRMRQLEGWRLQMLSAQPGILVRAEQCLRQRLGTRNVPFLATEKRNSVEQVRRVSGDNLKVNFL